ncbi:hypothetical protein [Metasolibacillus sp.]|uniref:hypothetical protein n=1 Tax=Metasolibacillus sp. TaxID=2703680 RepID=UPI0025DD1944|nr:hypothetical protein [Metasolibacillus sp.]MCT6924120.1 hypothetical protein [Metasolibacillus sp.]MCT6940227.1 hypothetical protein [Metasolibacillus sp.]
MTRKNVDLTGQKFGRLTAKYPTDQRKQGKIVWYCECECGGHAYVSTSYLTNGDTRSCGCLKVEQDISNIREGYEKERVDNVVMSLFKGQEPRKDSGTGFRGVSKYYTRKSKELRYRAWITVAGKRYYKSGFLTPEDAYFKGRLELEKKYLPKENENETEK